MKAILKEKSQNSFTEISSLTNVSRIYHFFVSCIQKWSWNHIKFNPSKITGGLWSSCAKSFSSRTPVFKTLFSHEVTFHVFSYVHTQNCRIWSSEKPTVVYEYQDNEKNKYLMYSVFELECWHLFFNGNVNTKSYVEVLKTYFWPILHHKCGEQWLIIN